MEPLEVTTTVYVDEHESQSTAYRTLIENLPDDQAESADWLEWLFRQGSFDTSQTASSGNLDQPPIRHPLYFTPVYNPVLYSPIWTETNPNGSFLETNGFQLAGTAGVDLSHHLFLDIASPVPPPQANFSTSFQIPDALHLRAPNSAHPDNQNISNHITTEPVDHQNIRVPRQRHRRSRRAALTARIWNCDICGEDISRRSDLERHKRSKHDTNFTIFCPVESCKRSSRGRGFRRQDHLAEHCLRMHPFLERSPIPPVESKALASPVTVSTNEPKLS